MFCSNCGMTIRAEDQVCPHCGAPIGDNRFGGIPYTSAQFKIAPGQTDFRPLNGYTRTSYTSMSEEAQQSGDVDSRTTYRPVYEGASAPEGVRKDMRAAVQAQDEAEPAPEVTPAPEDLPESIQQAARETLEKVDEELQSDEELDMSQFRSRPIKSSGRAGISRDVSEYIQKIEGTQTRRARHRRPGAPAYDEDYPEETAAQGGTYEGPAYGADEDNADGSFEEIDEDEFEELRRGARFKPAQIIKIVIAIVLVAALFVGGVVWLRYIRSKQSSSPIDGVTESFYNTGIALVKSHAETSYVSGLLTSYSSDLIALATQLDSDAAAVSALMPAEPAANDQVFMDALNAIQKNIGNAVTMDAVDMTAASATAIADSETRWQVVNNSIAQLEAVTRAEELTAITNGQTISVQTGTVAPTVEPTPVYATLQKGDKSDDVMTLQTRLYTLGYLNDDRDGAFGTKTQTAVKLFQETAGLTATGIADADTQAALYADNAPYAPGVAAPAVTVAPVEATTEPTATPEAAIQPAEAQGTAQAA